MQWLPNSKIADEMRNTYSQLKTNKYDDVD